MKNRLYIAAVSTGKNACGVSQWKVVVADPDYDRVRRYYDHLRVHRMFLKWELENGVSVLRVHTKGIQFVESLNDISLPFNALPADYRAGLHKALEEVLVHFLNPNVKALPDNEQAKMVFDMIMGSIIGAGLIVLFFTAVVLWTL